MKHAENEVMIERPVSFDPSTQGLLYLQIENDLKQSILDGTYAVGDRIPTEQELCERFGVSRITVRRAIQDLFEEGLLTKVRGRGTFVAVPKHVLGGAPAQNRGFETLSDNGQATGRMILEKDTLSATSDIAKKLEISEGDEVFYIRRLIQQDAFPMAIDNLFVAASAFEGLLDLMDDNVSFYNLVTQHYGYVFGVENLTIDASTTRGDEGGLLKYPAGSPLFILRKCMNDANGKPLHYSKSIVRADRISYHFSVDKDGRVLNRGDEFTLRVSN